HSGTAGRPALAKVGQKASHAYLRGATRIEERPLARGARQDCAAVGCGHPHHPVVNPAGPVHYFNSGSWTERPCTYLTVEEGLIELQTFQPADEAPETFVETEADAVAAR